MCWAAGAKWQSLEVFQLQRVPETEFSGRREDGAVRTTPRGIRKIDINERDYTRLYIHARISTRRTFWDFFERFIRLEDLLSKKGPFEIRSFGLLKLHEVGGSFLSVFEIQGFAKCFCLRFSLGIARDAVLMPNQRKLTTFLSWLKPKEIDWFKYFLIRNEKRWFFKKKFYII